MKIADHLRASLLRLGLLLLLAAGGGGCAVVTVPLGIAKTTAGVVYAGASALVPSGKKKDNSAAAAKNAAAADSKPVAPTTSSRERPFSERISKPDMTMAYLPAEKSFTATAGAPLGRTVPTKPFLSDRATPVREFPTAGAGGVVRAVPVQAYTGRVEAVGTRPAAGVERTVATRGVLSRELPEAKKAAPVRGADPRAGKLFAVKGKRQDMLDRDYAPKKPMTIDDVRDLLNKGPKAPEAR